MKPIDYVNTLPDLCPHEQVELIDKFSLYRCSFLISDITNKFARFVEPCAEDDWVRCPFRKVDYCPFEGEVIKENE